MSSGENARDSILKAVREASSGGVVWQQDKRKRQAWFENGQLILLTSNLKSESLERVGERFVGLPAEELPKKMLEQRMRGLLSEMEGEVKFLPGTPPQKEPADIFALLHSVGDLLAPAPPNSYPRVVTAPLLQRFPIDPELRSYVWELDGTRDLEEVVSFAPAPPDAVEKLLRACFGLGVIVDSGKATTLATVVGASETPSGTGIFPGGWETTLPPKKTGKTASKGLAMDDLFGDSEAPETEDPVRKWFGAHHERIRSAADHFGILGVRWDESPDTMRRAYFAIARDLHPDKFNDAPDDVKQMATELFDKARSAWEVLGDDTKREAYIARVIRGEKTEDEKATEKVQAILEGEGYFKRGINELNSGRIASAHENFQKACDLVPEETEFAAYLGYTRFRMNQGKDEMAASAGLDAIRAALKDKENLDNVWVLLGMVQRLKGDDASARRSFIKALQLKPANPDAAREMKRLEQTRQQAAEEPKASGGFFSRLFGKK